MLFFCTFFSCHVFPQSGKKEIPSDQPLRIEIPVKSDKETYRLIPCDSSGVMLFFKSIEQVEVSKTKWYFSFYDRHLQVSWTKGIALDENMEFRFQEFHQDTLVLLFVNTGKKKGSGPDVQVLSVFITKGNFMMNQGNLPDNAEVVFFSFSRQQAWLGLQTKNAPGQLLSLNLARGNRRLFLLGEGNLINLRWLSADPVGPFVKAVVTRQSSKKSWEHYLVCYDSTGKITTESLIGTMTPERNYTGFQSYSLGNGKDLILGTYGLNGERESSGLFAQSLSSDGTRKSTDFYHFLDLQHASALLSEKDVISLKKKALKKNKTGGDYPLDFNLLLHEVFLWKDDFILCGEIYNPQYHTESFTDFDFYGRPYSNSYSVFDGYRFTHAVIAGFSREGLLKWDNSLDFRNLVSFELNNKLCLFPAGENLVLCYLSDGRIGYKIIHAKEVVEKPEFIPVEMLHPGDKLMTETRSRMIPWYGSYFLCSGYQEIKNVSLDSNNKRLVFYFVKIRFED